MRKHVGLRNTSSHAPAPPFQGVFAHAPTLFDTLPKAETARRH
jgi:hypothetical protein